MATQPTLYQACTPHLDFKGNLTEVSRLLEIHTGLTGSQRGRRFGVEVLNKSAVVLTTACWEAFIEDLATSSFDHLLTNSPSPDRIPRSVRVLATKRLLASKEEDKAWDLAGDGWRAVLTSHRAATLARYVGTLNTPKPANIDDLFLTLLDLRSLSASWSWQKSAPADARAKLDRYVTLRGSIAHRVEAAESVTKAQAEDYRHFVSQLSIKTANRVREHLLSLDTPSPWDTIPF